MRSLELPHVRSRVGQEPTIQCFVTSCVQNHKLLISAFRLTGNSKSKCPLTRRPTLALLKRLLMAHVRLHSALSNLHRRHFQSHRHHPAREYTHVSVKIA